MTTLSNQLKGEAFTNLDYGKRRKMYVDINKLIDLCLECEFASEGEYENLDYNIKVLKKDKEKLKDTLEKISHIVPCNSEIWNLCNNTGVY